MNNRQSKKIYKTSVFYLVILSFFSFSIQAQTSKEVEILKNESWWGGAVSDGHNMPFSSGYSFDMYGTNKYNQVQPLLVSSMGRVIWSEEPFAFSFSENEIALEARGDIKIVQAGKTLKDAYKYASENYFPTTGELPDELLFKAPQYNTWIELMYNQNQKDILEYAHAIIDNGLPPGVLMIDDNWQEDYGKWNFHKERFPDPKAMINELHQLGFKVMLWVCPFVSPDSDVYRDLAKRELFLKNPETAKTTQTGLLPPNQPAMIHWWNGVSALLDFSNPDAKDWFRGELEHLQENYGVDGFKLDAGDFNFYPDVLVSHKPNTTPNEHAKLFGEIGLNFPLNEYRAMWKMGGQPLAQRLSDKGHRWGDLSTLIPNITVQGLMGYAYSAPDMIGGGEFSSFLNAETIDQELIVRSAQVHALMPMMQFSVAPWRILDREHLEAVKKSAALRKEFTPLIMRLAEESAKTGEPIVRTMEYSFPNKGFKLVKDQFMLGDKVLVAPVLKKGKRERSVQFPKGKWKDASGKVIKGPTKKVVQAGLDELPYFRKVTK
ncbi:alpha-glucosidase [Salegentibacter holothuriorum]|uniref:Alpha-glucosidase n=1 Tax=Salegentibacter holothuriorum TaxID=241145 RepID=A0A1T5E9V4_9FLAO|nr:glycoside hydrolase family 31 protein [Salegentibacter holothuriorum]SKB80559.1 alpha-glucosidase [Salegentibacter holothuriorum]